MVSVNTLFSCHSDFLQLPVAIFKLITECSIDLLPDNFTIPEHNHRADGFRGSSAKFLKFTRRIDLIISLPPVD